MSVCRRHCCHRLAPNCVTESLRHTRSWLTVLQWLTVRSPSLVMHDGNLIHNSLISNVLGVQVWTQGHEVVVPGMPTVRKKVEAFPSPGLPLELKFS